MLYRTHKVKNNIMHLATFLSRLCIIAMLTAENCVKANSDWPPETFALKWEAPTSLNSWNGTSDTHLVDKSICLFYTSFGLVNKDADSSDDHCDYSDVIDTYLGTDWTTPSANPPMNAIVHRDGE